MSTGAEGEKLRLFAAVSVPPVVLEEVERAVASHRDLVPGARWAPAANQHLTLKFLGWVRAERRADVVTACASAATRVRPGEISIRGAGAFPSHRRARVLWAGIVDEAGTLAALARALDDALQPLGFEPERRPYSPHLTLARLKIPADGRGFLEAVSPSSRAFEVAAFHLYRSRLSSKGARYDVLDTFELDGRDMS